MHYILVLGIAKLDVTMLGYIGHYKVWYLVPVISAKKKVVIKNETKAG